MNEDFVDMDEVDNNDRDEYGDYGDDYGDEEERESGSPTRSVSKKQKSIKRASKITASDSSKDVNNRSNSSGDGSRYDPENVANQMLLRKDRKIPHSVYKPHAE